jgi:hypothetical protein
MYRLGRGEVDSVFVRTVSHTPKPRANTAIYGETLMHIVVAGSRGWELRWWVLLRVATREEIRFPSVLLQPLGHLSVFRINGLRAVRDLNSAKPPF